MMDRDELAGWLRLLETPGIGLESARRLLAALGSPDDVFKAPQSAWRALLSAEQAVALSAAPEHLPALLARTLEWLQADPAHDVLTLADADYPAALLQTADPPLLLYLDGRRELLGARCIAVVGSRRPTGQGLDHARDFGQALSQAGLCVVSGLALGIDGAAHEGALKAAGGTIAVLGTGLDELYPRRHMALGARVATQGLLISEYALGTPALPPNFPRRNRIIAGLSLGCLVVEAALESGSLITARLASEAGREVFAIPGSVNSAMSRGCHALIRQGAKLVESVEDILEELPGQRAAPAPSATPSAQIQADADTAHPVLRAMGFDPISLDALMARCGWGAAELNAKLFELEMQGDVARLPGQLFQRRKRG